MRSTDKAPKEPARVARPAVPRRAACHLPGVQVDGVEGGLRVLLVPMPGRGMFSARLILATGSVADGPALQGVARLTAQAMTMATIRHDANSFSHRLECQGAALTAEATVDAASLTVTAPISKADAALSFLAEAVTVPALDPGDVSRLVARRLVEARREAAQPRERAVRAFSSATYGAVSGYGRPPGGVPETIERIDAAAARAWWSRHVTPSGATLLLAGDLGPQDAREWANRAFRGWRPRSGPALQPVPQPDTGGSGVVIENLPRSAQTVLACGRVVRVPDLAGVAALEVAVHTLGGWSGSRLNTVLREEKGYTYGVTADLVTRAVPGGYQCQVLFLTAVGASKAEAAVMAMFQEIGRVCRGRVRADDVRAAADNLLRSLPVRTQTTQQALDLYAPALERRLSPDFLERRTKAIGRIRPHSVVAAAARHVDPDELTLVLAGDCVPLASSASPGLASASELLEDPNRAATSPA
ncbi:M16 family metallopeptidase [Microbispora sp. ATCC PTA-5024]|uniref:M16 family metallopeptidase n=1 Tax=Microbispora sp. ATCC PTA-5024 TaxID=316330 RepID=UPI000A03641A|nr:pitrilysin family protein [Microbispora sp. ATCC PTA-5024]